VNQPDASFYHLGIAPDMLKVLDRLKFVIPTPIQQQAIPIALEGKDILGVAQTGTGKTLAFGIPIVQRLAADGGQAVILVPTRELALQVAEALEPLLNAFEMESVVLIGGVKMYGQISDIQRNPDVIIATPGRMNDHIYQGTLDLGRVVVAVLDEADRMLDMGFEPQVKSILRCLTNKEQTMLFSATMPSDVLKLANKYMKLPISIEIAPSGTAAKDVTQELFIVKESAKNDALKMLLQKYRGTVLVFIRTKMKASRVTRNIRAMGFKVAEIHSDRTMGQRIQAIEGFKRGRYRVLVATDIAARGIDISMIELVVNYDLPDDAENYVHRIGRTGRAGETGHAVTLATPTQSHDVKQIENLMKKALPRSAHPQYVHARFSDGDSGPVRRPHGHRPSGQFKGKPQGSGHRPRAKTGSGHVHKRNADNPISPHKRNSGNPGRRQRKSSKYRGSRPK